MPQLIVLWSKIHPLTYLLKGCGGLAYRETRNFLDRSAHFFCHRYYCIFVNFYIIKVSYYKSFHRVNKILAQENFPRQFSRGTDIIYCPVDDQLFLWSRTPTVEPQRTSVSELTTRRAMHSSHEPFVITEMIFK